MAKTLKEILEVYEPKSPDEKRFKDKHITVKVKDRNGNGDDVFNGKNVKAVDRSKEGHGYNPGEDEKVYEATMTAADFEVDHDGEQIDELKMSHGAYVSAMKRTTGYDAGSDEGRVDTDKLIARAKKNKGEKFANDLEGAHGMAERPNRNRVPGQWGSDKLAWRSPSKVTASGKANKSNLKGLKASLTKGDYRKPDFSKKKKLPEEFEQIDEAVAADMYDAHHARAMKSLDNMAKHLDKHKKLCMKNKGPMSWHASDMKMNARNIEDLEHQIGQQVEYATQMPVNKG